MSFRRKVKEYAEAPFSHYMVAEILPGYNSVNDKISELMKNGQLLSIRRGLYVPGPETDLPIPNKFLIANHLRGPSYVSLESALFYWQMIPEQVYEISSVTLKTTKTYTTDIGRFSYQYLKAPYYSFGVQRIQFAPQQFALFASKEKALCDKIALTAGVILRSIQQTKDFLLDDMRMDEEILRALSLSTIHSWLEDAPKRNSLKILIKTLEVL